LEEIASSTVSGPYSASSGIVSSGVIGKEREREKKTAGAARTKTEYPAWRSLEDKGKKIKKKIQLNKQQRVDDDSRGIRSRISTLK